MAKNLSVFLFGCVVCGCSSEPPATPVPETAARRQPVIIGKSPERPHVTASEAPPAEESKKEPETIRERRWNVRGRDYVDRNGDGIVDWEASGYGRGTDGYGTYKEDNDFDGFYERVYEAGGIRYEIISDKAIRERVPQIHRVYRPTSVRDYPKSDPAARRPLPP